WDVLAQAIRNIFQQDDSNLSYEELYRSTYNMVNDEEGHTLYEGVQRLIKEHLSRRLQEWFRLSNNRPNQLNSDSKELNDTIILSTDSSTMPTGDDPNLLAMLDRLWSEHSTCIQLIKVILLYMDRHYCTTAQVPLTYDMGLSLFRDVVLQSSTYQIQPRVLNQILADIDRERGGDLVDRVLLKKTITLFNTVPATSTVFTTSIYHTVFEPAIVNRTMQYYARVGAEKIQELGTIQFLRFTSRSLDCELERCQNYLPPETGSQLTKAVHAELVAAHSSTLLKMPSGLAAMVNQRQFEELNLLYTLFKETPTSLAELKAECIALILQLGVEINQQTKTELEAPPTPAAAKRSKNNAKGGNSSPVSTRWVQRVLELVQLAHTLVSDCFRGDTSFDVGFNQSFANFINQQAKSPEFLSLYIDDHLTRGGRGKSEADTDAALSSTVTVFRYLNDKDVFERYYKQHLAKRLLLQRSLSEDAERSMITKLKVECGYQFTSKLEGMFNDMRISAESNDEFQTYHQHTILDAVDFKLNVQVLTASYWPMPATSVTASSAPVTSTIQLPLELLSGLEAYNRFYLNKHNGRRLTWQLNAGHADIRCCFGTKKYILNVSTFQMLILLCFNEETDESTWLTFNDLVQRTSVPEYELRRNLRTLACGKYKVLTKDPPSSDIEPATDRFQVNAKFMSPLAKINNGVESESERRATQAWVNESRKGLVEAAIVRIMKQRKQLNHNHLLAEVTGQLQPRFLADPTMIKQRIEILIDRDYLERSANDRRVYKYLA
ncbi:cullin 3a, partial [Dimargaris cristalligena]